MDIKDEFKQYVTELTKSICKDIFLSRLEDICERYEKLEEKYKNLQTEYNRITQDATGNNKQLYQVALKIGTSTKELENFTEIITATIKHLDTDIYDFKDTINHMFTQVTEVSKINRTEFVAGVQSNFEQQREQLDKIFNQGYIKIEEELKSIVDADLLKEFIERLTANTNEMNGIISLFNDTYKEKVLSRIQEIVDNTEREQNRLNSYMEKRVQSLTMEIDMIKGLSKKSIDSEMDLFQKKLHDQEMIFVQYLTKILQEEKDNRKTLYDEHVNMLAKQKDALEVKYVELKNTLVSYQFKLEEMEEKSKRNNASWKIYITGMINLLIVLFGVNIVLQKPWEVFGVQNTVILLVILVMVFIILLLVKGLVANHKKNKKRM